MIRWVCMLEKRYFYEKNFTYKNDNARDSAVGGGYELSQAVSEGQSISQAIEEFKPDFQSKVNEANGKK